MQAANTPKRKKKREIHRRVCQYEAAAKQAPFGRLDDLETACRARKDPHEVVLVAYSMAKAAMKPNTSNGVKMNMSNDNKNSLAVRFGTMLWTAPFEGAGTALDWAVEAAAVRVVQFIVAWRILCQLNNNNMDGVQCGKQKLSPCEWLFFLQGSNDLQQVGEETRIAISNYRCLAQNRYTLDTLASCLVQPYIEFFPVLKKFVDQVLLKHKRISNGLPDVGVLAEAGQEVDEDGYSFCDAADVPSDDCFSLLDDTDCHARPCENWEIVVVSDSAD